MMTVPYSQQQIEQASIPQQIRMLRENADVLNEQVMESMTITKAEAVEIWKEINRFRTTAQTLEVRDFHRQEVRALKYIVRHSAPATTSAKRYLVAAPNQTVRQI